MKMYVQYDDLVILFFYIFIVLDIIIFFFNLKKEGKVIIYKEGNGWSVI